MSGVTLLVIAYVSLLVFAAAAIYRTVKMASFEERMEEKIKGIPGTKWW